MNPGGPASGSAVPTMPKAMPKGPPPKAEPDSLAILLFLLDGSREGRVVSLRQG